MPQMEHPFYSSKKPETKIRRYEHNGSWLEISRASGLATILRQGHPDLLHFTDHGKAQAQ